MKLVTNLDRKAIEAQARRGAHGRAGGQPRRSSPTCSTASRACRARRSSRGCKNALKWLADKPQHKPHRLAARAGRAQPAEPEVASLAFRLRPFHHRRRLGRRAREPRLAPATARGSRSPSPAASAAPASTSAASRRSCSPTPRTSARTSRSRAAFGWTVGEPRFDWPTLLANKDREIARLNGVYERVLVERRRRDPPRRAPRCSDRTKSRSTARRVTRQAHPRRHRLLAGAAADSRASSTRSPRTRRSTSSALPQRAVVVGGGYIALEFASIFHGLGVRDHAHLPRQAPAARLRRRARHAHRRGDVGEGRDDLLRLRAGRDPQSRRRASRSSSPTARIEQTDLVMFATGRRPNTAKLGLEAAA